MTGSSRRSRRFAHSLLGALAVATLASACAARGPADAGTAPGNGLVTVVSVHDVARTLALLDSALLARGITVVARVEHDVAAARVGQSLRPTRLIIAGNPAAGTPLMRAGQSAGIDLPLRFLVWQDEAGKVNVSYNDLRRVAERHGIRDQQALVDRMNDAMRDVVQAATGTPATR